MVRALRRAVMAFTAAGVVAAIVRLRSSEPPPSQGGGWRELSGPELR